MGRIATTYPEFDKDIKKFYNRANLLEEDGITLRGITLGLSTADMATLKNFSFKWTCDDPDTPGLYDLLQDSTKRLGTTPAAVKLLIKDFKVFFQPCLNIIAASRKIDLDDRAAFNIAPPVTTHSEPKDPITVDCYALTAMLGSGKVKYRCRTTTDGKRASKPKNADAVELAYRIDPPYVPADSASGDPVSKVKNPLASADDKTTKAIFSKASFIFEAGQINIGNVLQYYTRFINTKHPNLNGPWTGPETKIIG